MQAVDHPYLVVYSQSSGANANLNDENKKESECGLCHEPAEDSVVSVSILSIYCYFAVSGLWFLSDCISAGFFLHFGQESVRFLLLD